MAVGGGGDKVTAAHARRGSFLRTGVASGWLAGQGWKSRRHGLPTARPRPRRKGKTGQGPAGNLPNGPLGSAQGKRGKGGESQGGVTKRGGPARKLGNCENRRRINSQRGEPQTPWRNHQGMTGGRYSQEPGRGRVQRVAFPFVPAVAGLERPLHHQEHRFRRGGASLQPRGVMDVPTSMEPAGGVILR